MKYLIIILAILMTSCMQYKEEIFLEKDMSGKIKFQAKIYQQWKNFSLPPKEKISLDIRQITGLNLAQYEEQISDSLISLDIIIEFNQIDQLQRLFAKDYLHPYLGDISLTKNKKGHWVVRRLMEGKESPFFEEKEIIENLTLAEKKTMDLGLPWSWVVHPPSDVLYRTKGFRREPNSPMTYDVNFKKVASAGVKLRMVFENEEADVPLNVWIATVAFGIVMFAIGLGIIVGSRKKRARIIPPKK